MRQSTTKLYNWSIEKANSEKAPFWLALLFSLELILFIPLDAILMFFCLQNRSKIFLYVAIATIASTLSGLLGYTLGHYLWDLIQPAIIPYFISESSFTHFSTQFQTYEELAVFFGSLLPFPLKILSLVSGAFQLGVLPFLGCMLAARAIRFTLIGLSMAIWGEKVKTFLDKHFHRVFLLIGAKIALAAGLFWFFAH